MRIGFCGLGKLGLPVSLAVESKGHQVWGYDISSDPYKYLKEKKIPYKEKDIQPLLNTNKIRTTQTVDELVENTDLIFVSVQTPHKPEYEGNTPLPITREDFDYSYLRDAIFHLSNSAKAQKKSIIIATISTCLPGTFSREIKHLLNEYTHYVYTPQFIAMGTVLEDYLYPEFNLIGVEDELAANTLGKFYETINNAPHLDTDITTAEGIKVSYNTWITAKTVIANTWGELAHKTGMNFDDIYRAWSLSGKRLLSNRYMDSGVGDGGGCHPRDNIALSYIADKVGLSHNLFEDLMLSRERHMKWLGTIGIQKSMQFELPLYVLGKAFKPETNIETGSPAVLMTNIIKDIGYPVYNAEDIDTLAPGVYIIGTKHQKYQDYQFPAGSIIIDPFRFIPKLEGVTIIHIGKYYG